MPSLNPLITVNIKVSATAPQQANFGVPAIFAYHTHYASLYRYYTSLADMVSDGFSVTEPAYLAAEAVMSQDPAPAEFMIGRRALPYTQIVHLLLSSTSASDTYTFNIVGSDGVSHAISVASTGVAATDAATISTALGLLSNIGTPSHSSATVTVTQASGKLNNFLNWGTIGAAGAPIIALTDATADPGIATDLAAVFALDQGWYGVALDSNSAAEIEAAAPWIESNPYHFFSANNSDVADTTAGPNVFTVLKAENFGHTIVQFNGTELLSYGGAALLGVILPQTPGSYTAAYKTEVSVPADPNFILTGTAISNITNNNGNYYGVFKGIAVLIQGITPGGNFADTSIFIDWLTDAIQTAVFTLLTNNPKIAYTNDGVGQVVSVIKGVLAQGVTNGGLAPNTPTTPITVNAPLVENISISNVAARNLPNVTFKAFLAGAIQTMQINGQVVLP